MNDLVIFAIYDRPRDFPNTVVCRVWRISAGVATADPLPYIVGPTLPDVRAALLDRHPGLSCVHREPEDDPVIAETWL